MQAVYAYGGATLFVEFMSEMRRPFDFWKGMICAQIFIYCVYMIFVSLLYSMTNQLLINNHRVSLFILLKANLPSWVPFPKLIIPDLYHEHLAVLVPRSGRLESQLQHSKFIPKGNC